MEVHRIRPQDTYIIRKHILRPHAKPEDEVKFSGDFDELSFHLGAFDGNKLISVASFYNDNHQAFTEDFQYRLRGMATLKEFQGQGFSSALLKSAFAIIKPNQCKLLWCNARVSAQGFYQKVGFETYGDVFDIPEIGPHQVMFIRI